MKKGILILFIIFMITPVVVENLCNFMIGCKKELQADLPSLPKDYHVVLKLDLYFVNVISATAFPIKGIN